MNENVARRPRFRRTADFDTTRLTERDKAIVASVSRYRFLTTSLILSLVPGSRQNIIRRLQRLYHAGFLDRPRAQLSLRYAGELSEIVYCPTPKAGMGRGCRPVTSLFLAHSLSVAEVLIRFESAVHLGQQTFIQEGVMAPVSKSQKRCHRIQWRTRIRSGSFNEFVGVIPDAAFAVEQRGKPGSPRRNYFLEVDRGTMPIWRKNLRLSSIRHKALAYLRTGRSNVLRESFGIRGFQVLFISESAERLIRMKETCQEIARARSRLFLFATLDDIRTSPDAALLETLWPESVG